MSLESGLKHFKLGRGFGRVVVHSSLTDVRYVRYGERAHCCRLRGRQRMSTDMQNAAHGVTASVLLRFGNNKLTPLFSGFEMSS